MEWPGSGGSSSPPLEFRPQPPLAQRGKAAAHECRVSVVKYRVGSKADTFVEAHAVRWEADESHAHTLPHTYADRRRVCLWRDRETRGP